MYHRTLKIALFGLDSAACDAIEAVQVPDRFEYEFYRADTVDVSVARECALVVATSDSLGDVPLQALSEATRKGTVGFRGLAIVANIGFISQMTPADYELIDALWPNPLTPECAAFLFWHVSDRVKKQADRYMNEAYLNTIIDSMPAMVWFKALDGEHVKVNSYFCEIVDKPREDVEGKGHNYIWNVPPEDWEKAELTCKESDNMAISAGRTVRCDEYVSTHGEIRLFDTYKSPVFDEDGSILGTSGFAHDITLEREMEDLTWRNAHTDYLTELYNRRYFYEYMEEHGDEGPMTYILIDLDNFKEINDESGHSAGDAALLETTSVLHDCFPDCAVVRWGGDEFVVVVTQDKASLATDEHVSAFQAKLAERTAKVCPLALTASIGIATKEVGEPVDEAIKYADKALYRAKAAGKACHVRHSG